MYWLAFDEVTFANTVTERLAEPTQMWLRICYRLRQAWGRVALWKRAVVMAIGLCLLIQLAFGFSLWREATVRQQLAGKTKFSLGRSPLPVNVERVLWHVFSPESLRLLAPIKAAVISRPTADDLRLISLLGIKHLTIDFGNFSETDLTSIGSNSRLETLELEANFIDAKALAPIAECGKLRSLKIVGRLAPEALTSLHRCVFLSELHLVYPASGGLSRTITGSHLAAAAGLPNLKSLTIYSPGMNGAAVDLLAGAQRLEELFLYQVDFTEGSLNGLSQLPQLKLLSLSLMTSDYVDPLHGFPALSTLALHGARISPQFLASLRRAPHLDTLAFTGCWVNDSLHVLAKNSKLKRLNVETSDANVEGLRRIGRLHSLEVLKISGFQDLEEFRDLFPCLQSPSTFAWDFCMDKDPRFYGAPAGGMGFF